MPHKNSLQEVFRRYLESERLPDATRSIVELIASGGLSRASFDKLLQSRELLSAPNLKEILLDLTLVFTRECLADHELTEAEKDDLDALVTHFRIEEGDFYNLRRAQLQELITAQAVWMLQDRYVTDQEEVLQRDLQRVLGLSYDQYVELLRPLAKKHVEELEGKRILTQDRDELKSIDSGIRNLRDVFIIARS
jgi:hypothetical protein